MKFCHHLLTLILISRVLKPLTSESSFRILCQLNSITTTGPAPAYKNLFSWKMNNLHGDQGNMVLFCKSTLSVEYSALPLWTQICVLIVLLNRFWFGRTDSLNICESLDSMNLCLRVKWIYNKYIISLLSQTDLQSVCESLIKTVWNCKTGAVLDRNLYSINYINFFYKLNEISNLTYCFII